jgi:hypothetical protein
MNKYRLRLVHTYDEINAVRDDIIYDIRYWPKSQILFDYLYRDFETEETLNDDELMILDAWDEDGTPYTYVSLNALAAIYKYDAWLHRDKDFKWPDCGEVETDSTVDSICGECEVSCDTHCDELDDDWVNQLLMG